MVRYKRLKYMYMQSKERKFLKLKKQMINYYKTKLADYFRQ